MLTLQLNSELGKSSISDLTLTAEKIVNDNMMLYDQHISVKDAVKGIRHNGVYV